MRVLGLVLCLATVLGGSAAIAEEPARNAIAPQDFRPPPDRPTSPLEEQKALIYRDRLETQRRELEARGADRNAAGARQLQDTRREISRMNDYLRRP